MQSPAPPDPVVLHADPWLLVIDKPSGLLSQSGRGPALADAVPTRLEPAWGPLRLPHRLDRDTSGLLLLARDPETHRSLSMALEARRVRRTYLADVAGWPSTPAGRVEAALAKARHRPPLYRVHPAGRPSRTDWWCLERGDGWCRLRLEPHTGRSHQLRVHLAWLGHPILGDPLYGHARSRGADGRLRLHAWRLDLVHPRTGAPFSLEAPLPWHGAPPGPLTLPIGSASQSGGGLELLSADPGVPPRWGLAGPGPRRCGAAGDRRGPLA